jgi:hypothetical protein
VSGLRAAAKKKKYCKCFQALNLEKKILPAFSTIGLIIFPSLSIL